MSETAVAPVGHTEVPELVRSYYLRRRRAGRSGDREIGMLHEQVEIYEMKASQDGNSGLVARRTANTNSEVQV